MNQQTPQQQIPTVSEPSFVEQIQKQIDFSDGINGTEAFFLLLIFTLIISKFTSAIEPAKKVIESLTYVSKEDLELLNDIENCMQRLMSATQSDRIIIGLFHNGTTDKLGFHEKKISAIFEVTDRLKPTKDQVQSIPIDFVKEEILLADDKYFQTYKRGNLHSRCDEYLDRIGIVRKDFKLLKDNRSIYGLINIHFLVEPEEHYLDNPSRIKQISYITSQLEYFLDKYRKPNQPKWRRYLTKLFKK